MFFYFKKKNCFKLSSYYSVFLLSVLRAQQLLWDLPLAASCLRHKTLVLEDMTTEDPAVTFKNSTVRLNSTFTSLGKCFEQHLIQYLV